MGRQRGLGPDYQTTPPSLLTNTPASDPSSQGEGDPPPPLGTLPHLFAPPSPLAESGGHFQKISQTSPLGITFVSALAGFSPSPLQDII